MRRSIRQRRPEGGLRPASRHGGWKGVPGRRHQGCGQEPGRDVSKKPKKSLTADAESYKSLPRTLGYRSIGRTSDSGSDDQGSSPCSPASKHCFARPHRLAGPGQRPFTPSTAVQIRLGTPMKSPGYVHFCHIGYTTRIKSTYIYIG